VSLARASVLGLAMVVGCLPKAAPAQATPQSVRVIDGDTLRLDGQTIRLHGIDAPEAGQMCGASPCGDLATEYLQALIVDRIVICNARGQRDRYDRMVAVCRVDGLDLGAAMVLAGQAMAFERYSRDYVQEQQIARDLNAGSWQFGMMPPSMQPVETVPPAPVRQLAQPAPPQPTRALPTSGACPIKGNINSRGDRIYHLPSSPNYARTIPEECHKMIKGCMCPGKEMI
jgi:endonuclease YncB( thermonuclease family)